MRGVRIKICGVTRIEDAQAAVELGADFIGLNFSERSERRIDAARGREIADAVRGRTSLVGVFVDQPAADIDRTRELVGLDLVQFHGDESPADLAPLGERAVKAVRFVGRPDPEELTDYKTVWGFVVEPRHGERAGGSGLSWDYRAARRLPRDKPFLLAGGLRPSNVAAAIDACGPWGVDVCSGVESEPRVKDAERMRRFFSEVERAQS